MKLPQTYEDLFTEKLAGPYLEEFVDALRHLKPSDKSGDKKMRAVESSFYDFVVDNVQPRIAQDGLTGNELAEIFQQHEPKKKFELTPFDHPEYPEARAMTGDLATGLAMMRAKLFGGRAFHECLSLQNGWQKKLLSFCLQGGTFINSDNMQQISGDPVDRAFEVNFKPYRIEIVPNESITEERFNPGMYAYDYMFHLQDYARRSGRRADDILQSHVIFNQPYDQKPEQGMSAIFVLARAKAAHLSLAVACQYVTPKIDIGPFLTEMAAKHKLPVPPDAEPLRSASTTRNAIPKVGPDGKKYN